MYSKRKYQVSICENVGNIIVGTLNLADLLHIPTNNDNLPEWEYAIKDIVDLVLDLKEGQSMYFQPNRDNSDSKGIIFRSVLR